MSAKMADTLKMLAALAGRTRSKEHITSAAENRCAPKRREQVGISFLLVPLALALGNIG